MIECPIFGVESVLTTEKHLAIPTMVSHRHKEQLRKTNLVNVLEKTDVSLLTVKHISKFPDTEGKIAWRSITSSLT